MPCETYRNRIFPRLLAGVLVFVLMLTFNLPHALALPKAPIKPPNDSPCPDPAVPYYMRGYTVLVEDWSKATVPPGTGKTTPEGYVLVEDPVPKVTWAWSVSCTNNTMGQIWQSGRFGDTISYLRLDPNASEIPLSTKSVLVPIPTDPETLGKKLYMADDLTPIGLLMPYSRKFTPVFGQPGGTYKPSHMAAEVSAPLPDGPDAIRQGIPTDWFNSIVQAGYPEVTASDGSRYAMIEGGSHAGPLAGTTLFHRLDYGVRLRNGQTVLLKDLPRERWNEIVGLAPELSPLIASTTLPLWDEYKPKPKKGFYRAAQTWHPTLGGRTPQIVPGGIMRVVLQGYDLSVSVPEVVRGTPGKQVTIPLTFRNATVKTRFYGTGYFGPAGGEPTQTWTLLTEKMLDPGYLWLAPTPDGKAQEAKTEITVTVGDKEQVYWVLVTDRDPKGKKNYEPGGDIDLTNNIAYVRVVPSQPNLVVHDMWYSPADVAAGDTVKVSVAVKNDPSAEWDQPIDTTISWYVDEREVGRVPVTGLAPGEDRRVILGTFRAPNAASVKVRAVANPGQNAPPNEARWDDNAAERIVPIRQQDLSIHVNAPSQIYITDKRFPVAVNIRNSGKNTLTTEAVLTMDGRTVWSKTLTVPAGQTISHTLWFRPQMLGTITFTGVVDPNNRIPESNEGNNRSTARTQVLPNPNVPSPPPPDDGLKAVLVGA